MQIRIERWTAVGALMQACTATLVVGMPAVARAFGYRHRLGSGGASAASRRAGRRDDECHAKPHRPSAVNGNRNHLRSRRPRCGSAGVDHACRTTAGFSTRDHCSADGAADPVALHLAVMQAASRSCRRSLTTGVPMTTTTPAPGRIDCSREGRRTLISDFL